MTNDKKELDTVIDVLDASYPLMTILREKTTGTYAHCKNVSAFMESLGVELKLNVQYMKIAGMYHDIGKVVNPRYFIENISDDDNNPHDNLEPYISHKIITSHIGNTAQILVNDGNIPREVIKWCTQHHGNSVVKFFYQQSDQKSKDSYRYINCTTPTSLEAGLLMFSDHLEAKCRALFLNDKLDNIPLIVDEVFDYLMSDRQLDNIELPKLSYIRAIKEILTRELNGIYRSKRIDYDAEEKVEQVE